MHCPKWIFNPPHALHFGGVWERQIGTVRRILDAMLLGIGSAQLTHKLLVTLMAEVTGIVNSRPIATLPSDVDEPQPLTPTMVLTMKTRPLTLVTLSDKISMRAGSGGEPSISQINSAEPPEQTKMDQPRVQSRRG